jgi:hypothetical protein
MWRGWGGVYFEKGVAKILIFGPAPNWRNVIMVVLSI